MRRVENWAVRLSEASILASAKNHAWGAHDCVTFAADAVIAMTDDDLISDVRGEYDSPVSAARLIKKAGFDCLGDMVADRLPEIDPRHAQRGDLILSYGDEGEFLAVVIGRGAVGPAAFGLIHIPLAQAARAFQVGERDG